MTKSKRLILVFINVAMIIAGLIGLISFIILTQIHSRHGFSGYASRNEIITTTDVPRLQTMGVVASDGWQRFTDVIDANRWLFLILGTVLLIGSILNFCLTPWRLKNRDDQTG